MPSFTCQSANPRGAVMHTFTVPAAHLGEAHALARRWAASLVAGSPEGKDWSGWSVEVLDLFGRYLLSVPMTAAEPVEQLPPAEKPRAVVRTPTKSLFIEEITALYERPEFPKPLA